MKKLVLIITVFAFAFSAFAYRTKAGSKERAKRIETADSDSTVTRQGVQSRKDQERSQQNAAGSPSVPKSSGVSSVGSSEEEVPCVAGGGSNTAGDSLKYGVVSTRVTCNPPTFTCVINLDSIRKALPTIDTDINDQYINNQGPRSGGHDFIGSRIMQFEYLSDTYDSANINGGLNDNTILVAQLPNQVQGNDAMRWSGTTQRNELTTSGTLNLPAPTSATNNASSVSGSVSGSSSVVSRANMDTIEGRLSDGKIVVAPLVVLIPTCDSNNTYVKDHCKPVYEQNIRIKRVPRGMKICVEFQ